VGRGADTTADQLEKMLGQGLEETVSARAFLARQLRRGSEEEERGDEKISTRKGSMEGWVVRCDAGLMQEPGSLWPGNRRGKMHGGKK